MQVGPKRRDSLVHSCGFLWVRVLHTNDKLRPIAELSGLVTWLGLEEEDLDGWEFVSFFGRRFLKKRVVYGGD